MGVELSRVAVSFHNRSLTIGKLCKQLSDSVHGSSRQQRHSLATLKNKNTDLNGIRNMIEMCLQKA
jgi:hypothetical protein